jgi:peptidoglycan/xylan/chitin deacetylase (PgdA/CDA1 family)
MRFFERASAHLVRRVPVKILRSRLTRSIASITFDDFAKSSWQVGGPILARHRAQATYFVSGSLLGRTLNGIDFYDANDLLGVHSAGHEIGSHTYSHWSVKHISKQELLTDVAENDIFIRDILSDVVPETFAYPYGDTSIRTKVLFARRFSCCRGTELGINKGLLDLAQLKAVPIDAHQWDANSIDRWIAEASCTAAWLIFVAHDISNTPTQFGCTPLMIDEVLAKIRAANIEILTVKNAIGRACFAVP